VYGDGRVYWPNFGARVPRPRQGFFCADAKTGEILYSEQPEQMPETVYAAPLLAGGRIYIPSLVTGTYVLEAGPSYKLLAHNKIEGDDTTFNASPAPLGNDAILLRSDKAIYCIR
ncbi:MAG: serine/threonine protein kinase, partial [Candidatus Sumerlaeia bacterium]